MNELDATTIHQLFFELTKMKSKTAPKFQDNGFHLEIISI